MSYENLYIAIYNYFYMRFSSVYKSDEEVRELVEISYKVDRSINKEQYYELLRLFK